MDRRKFLNSMSVATAATITGAATFSDKADALEDAMSDSLEKRRQNRALVMSMAGRTVIRMTRGHS